MNTKKFALFGLIFVILLIGVAGCASNGIEAGLETEAATSTAVTAEPSATDTPDPTPTDTPEPTSVPTFEEKLGIENLSPAGEDIKELVTVLQEAGEEVTFKASACENMDEPYLVLTEGDECKALSEFMVEDLRIYETTKLFLIFDGEVSLDDLHNPLLLQEGKIGDYTFYIVDVSELKYINDDYTGYAHGVFVRYHGVLGFSEDELRESFTNPGKTELAEGLAHNLFLGCSVTGDPENLEVFHEAQDRDNFGDLSFVKSFHSLVESGGLKLDCNPEQTSLGNLVGAFSVSSSFDSVIEDSALVVEPPSIESIPTQEPLPFPEEEGNVAWDHFVEIKSQVQERTGLTLLASFGECRYPTTPWNELVVYQNGNECWAINSIKSHNVDDINPETEQIEYYAGLAIRVGKVHGLDMSGNEYNCVEAEEAFTADLNMASYIRGSCIGHYARMNMFVPESGFVPESALGFNREAISNFDKLDALDGSGNFFYPGFDRSGIVGVDKETYMFLSHIFGVQEIYTQPFEIEIKEIQ